MADFICGFLVCYWIAGALHAWGAIEQQSRTEGGVTNGDAILCVLFCLFLWPTSHFDL